MTVLTDRQLTHIVALVTDLRPDWDLHGVQHWLRKCSGWPHHQVALTAVAAAADPAARTPRVIEERLRRGFRPDVSVEPATPTPPKIPKADTRRPSTPPTEAYLRAKEQLR